MPFLWDFGYLRSQIAQRSTYKASEKSDIPEEQIQSKKTKLPTKEPTLNLYRLKALTRKVTKENYFLL